jgi:hypothetical protein
MQHIRSRCWQEETPFPSYNLRVERRLPKKPDLGKLRVFTEKPKVDADGVKAPDEDAPSRCEDEDERRATAPPRRFDC